MNISTSRNKKQKVKTAARRSNSSNRWLQRQLNDPYVQEAKKLNYRSRAAFKIIDIDNKYNLLKPGMNIVDLGCAPGGWSQICTQKVGKKGSVIGIDLIEIEPIDNCKFYQIDFTDDEVIDILNRELAGKKLHGVISDMAANTTGHKKTDHLKIMNLIELAADFAINNLDEGGFFIAKVFSGGTESNFLKFLKNNFEKTSHFKPASSRKDSPEMYLIATGFKKT